MEFSAEMIAAFLEGEIAGDKDIKVCKVAKIEEGVPGALSFLSNPKYEHYIYETEASIVITDRDFVPNKSVKPTLIKVDDPYGAFAKLLDLYVANMPVKTGIAEQSTIKSDIKNTDGLYVGEYVFIGENVKLGENVKIYPHAFIGDNVKIGNDVIIYAGARIYNDCVIGNNVTIHSGAVIGADGFGFAPVNGSFKKIPQIGNVIFEDNVDIGANTCVDRATMGSTIVKKGVKLDNLIQIGHNVFIDENTVAAAQVGIAGSSKVGKNCMFGGQVGIAGHLNIADGTQIASQSGIASSVKSPGSVLMGTPAFNAIDFKRSQIIYRTLPELSKKIYALENEIKKLKEQLG